MPTEIVIADDGSTMETKRVVDHYATISTVPILHAWHEDNGFRLAAIRNRALQVSSSDYIIQIDGDLILHPYFVYDHIALASNNAFFTGTRVMLSEHDTIKILHEKTSKFVPSFSLKNIRWPWLSSMYLKMQKGLHPSRSLGANMSFWRADLLAINGYNEDFIGWGKEDNDIAARLINLGRTMKALRASAISYHLYHPEASRGAHTINEQLYRTSLDTGITHVKNGIY
jgi:glycosyltransferase involved in cell wall biosynthesis